LLRKKPKSLSWTPAATLAFQSLKDSFTRALLLTHPDPNKPFIVEVDASTTEVGAVLSQQQGNLAHLHPCGYFSKKLSPAEINYNIGNRELLAIKLAQDGLCTSLVLTLTSHIVQVQRTSKQTLYLVSINPRKTQRIPNPSCPKRFF